jgi:pSer/pThr/pTyr-binding forkhead associated (FHA) protein
LRDLNSTNGTFVNEQRTQEQRLLDGDVIRIGSLELQYELNVADRLAIPTSAMPAEFTVEKKPMLQEAVRKAFRCDSKHVGTAWLRFSILSATPRQSVPMLGVMRRQIRVSRCRL